MSVIRDLRIGLKGSNGALIRLIIINCVVFLLVNIIGSILALSHHEYAYAMVTDYTELPSDLHRLPVRFWTLFTYMFVHEEIFHLFSNMLWLYFLGRLFSDLLGGARLTATYILGGLCGGILFVIVDNMLPRGGHTHLLGASAGVMAVVVAVAAYSPDTRVYPFGIPVKLKWLALISFLLTSVIDLSANTGGKIAHIGGAAFGLLYGSQFRRRSNFLEAFTKLFRFKKSSHLKVEHSRSMRGNDEVFNMTRASIRKRVDEILDKISRSGYDSLSKDEKEFLQKNHDKF